VLKLFLCVSYFREDVEQVTAMSEEKKVETLTSRKEYRKQFEE